MEFGQDLCCSSRDHERESCVALLGHGPTLAANRGWPRQVPLYAGGLPVLPPMKLSLVPDLRCPRCQAHPLVAHEFESTDGRCRSGVLACTACPAWYPISDYILELLPEESEEPGRRADFFRRHRSELRSLGLEAPALQGEATDHLLSPQAKQREHFDDLASRDDEFTYRTALGLTPFWQVLRDRTFSEWEPIVRSGSRVLDVGCADGLSTFPMARTGAEVLAFDISRESILQAGRRRRRRAWTT